MMLLRLLGFILLYIGIGLALYMGITENLGVLLWVAGLIVIGGILILMTQGNLPSSYRRNSGADWLAIIELLEIPIKLLIGLFRLVGSIFT